MMRGVYPAVEKAESVFQTTLQNGNPVIHPAVTLLNAGLIERTHGAFLFYEEGVTESVGRMIEAVDRERLAIAERARASGCSPSPSWACAQGYMDEQNYSTGYSTAPGFLGIGAQHQLDHRYLTEDVGYGLVFLTDLARHARGGHAGDGRGRRRRPRSSWPATSAARAAAPWPRSGWTDCRPRSWPPCSRV